MRCSWCNLDNPLYVSYHDNEWGVPKYDDKELFELLILELNQAGLSWETILNKRDNFREAYDNFDVYKVAKYDQNKINKLMDNKGIIRNKRKIDAAIKNAQVFIKIQEEYKTFSNYIWHFTNNKQVFGEYKTTNELSDGISKDLKQRGMSFVGSTIIYSYLQAIGIIDDHEKTCIKYKGR